MSGYNRTMDDMISSTSSSIQSERIGWLDVNAFNLEVEKNKQRNSTENYKWQNNKKLVVRKGVGFTIQLATSKPFNLRTHSIILVFNIGTGRSESNATQQIQVLPKLAMEQSQFGTDWTAELVESDDTTVTVDVHIPVKCIVGCWRFRIFSGSLDENEQISHLHECSASKFQKTDIYVLFNPFMEADASYYENVCERTFYLNQEVELSFTGTKVGPNGYSFSKTPWVHGQFDENTLKTAVFLLEKMTKDASKQQTNGITVKDRMNIVRVIRKMAFAVKNIFFNTTDLEIDDTNYISTRQLIDKFIETQRSLAATESFIHANLYISLVRSLGICARSVTCIEASYDADPTLTVDRAFVKDSDDFTFEPMKNSMGQLWECTRTYHIWVECFCRRMDIGAEFDGWQLVDPTAPESPLSARQFGPASLRCLKETKLDAPYDARLFYGMYRSNKVQWFYEYESETDEYRLLHVKFCWENELSGRAILTADPRCPLNPIDITEHYYNIESTTSNEQDGSLRRPSTSAGQQANALKTAGALERYQKIRLLYGSNVLQNPSDVKITVTPIDNVIFGDNVVVTIEFKNNSPKHRTVNVSVRVHSRNKDGKIGTQVNSYKETYDLPSGQNESLRLLTPVSEYIRGSGNDNFDFVAVISGTVHETGQIFFHEEHFHLSTSILGIVAPATASLNQIVIALIAITNPLPEPLRYCKLELTSGHKADQIVHVERMPSEIAPGQRIKLPIRIRLPSLDLRVLVAKLHCQPLGKITASHILEVKDE